MKYIIPILLLLLPVFVKANLRDTVPSGVPQLFGAKYYKFNGYILVDSFIMNSPGDTNNIPYYPSLKFKSSDNRWYGWNRTNWNRFLYSSDTLTRANNGLSISGDFTQLGQAVGATGNPAQLLSNREIPSDGFTLAFKDTGSVHNKLTLGSGTIALQDTNKSSAVVLNHVYTNGGGNNTFTQQATINFSPSNLSTGYGNAILNIIAHNTKDGAVINTSASARHISYYGLQNFENDTASVNNNITISGTPNAISGYFMKYDLWPGASNQHKTINGKLVAYDNTIDVRSVIGSLTEYTDYLAGGILPQPSALFNIGTRRAIEIMSLDTLNNVTNKYAIYQRGINDTNYFAGMVRLPNVSTSSDTSLYKPAVFDSGGNLSKLSAWPGGGGTVTQVNTGYGLTGGPITSTGTIFADTISTNGLATKNYVNAAPWPEEAPIGVIYQKNNWNNLSDFSVNTSGGATTQLALSGGYINYSVSSIDWDNYTTILPTRPTALPNWTIETDFKMITAPAAGTIGFGIGTHKIIGGNGDVLCYVQTTSGGGSGTISINRGDGALTWATGTSSTINQNDVVRMTVTFVDSLITFTVANLTTGGTVGSISYTNTLSSTTSPLSLLSNWAFIGHSSTPCTWQIQSVTVSSQTERNANLIGIGDSKTQGAFADYFSTRFISLLGNTYPTSIIYASGNATINDFLTRMGEEMTYLNGVQYLVSLGSNDKRNGATLAEMQDRYTKLIKILQGGGATVRHIVIPEDSTAGGVGLTAFKNWVQATYPNDYIDIWTVMSTNNILKTIYSSGDGVHPNNAGHLVIDSLVRASGKILVTPAVRRSPFRVTDNNIKISKDSIYLDPVDKGENYVNHWDINGAARTGLLQDNGSTVGVSIGPMVPLGGSQMTVSGFFGINGPGSGLIFGDRERSLVSGATYSLYGQGGTLRVFSNVTGSDLIKIDSLGRMGIGGAEAVDAFIKLPFGQTGAGKAPVKFSSTLGAEILTTPEPGALEAKHLWLMYTDSTGTRDTIATRRWVRDNLPTSGTYTPTLTNGTNVDSSIAFPCQYMRVGNTVTVSGRVDIAAISKVSTVLSLSLPIASAFTNDYQLGGTAASGTEQFSGSIRADATNDIAQLDFHIPSTGVITTTSWFFSFTYQIL